MSPRRALAPFAIGGIATLAALSIGMTSRPSIAASRARIGSTSVTITCEPIPLARIATPLPHQP